MGSVCRSISIKQLIEMLINNDIILLDVREKEEYKEKHLSGSKNITIENLRKEVIKKFPDKRKRIIVYCSSGTRSLAACQMLREMGYKKVYNIQGGIDKIL